MNSAYVQSVRKLVDGLKRIARPDELRMHVLPCAAGAGHLLPVCDLHRDDRALLDLLTNWRRENAPAFPSQFTVTLEGTARWLRHGILDNENRVLFLVCDPAERPVGHVGLCDFLNDRRELEAENIVRGVPGTAPGLMSHAMQALLAWCYELGAERVRLRVFQDNAHAIAFYRRLGFRDDEVIPLRKHIKGDTIVYRPAADDDGDEADRYFLRMVHVENQAARRYRARPQ